MQKETVAMNAAVKRLDVICIGRVAVDLYAQQIGARLEDVASFSKYLGGSSGNVAFGTAIQGLKSAMLARVGDEHNGRFLRETLSRAGVDTEYLITDQQRLTALVMLGIKDQETFPLIFYLPGAGDHRHAPFACQHPRSGAESAGVRPPPRPADGAGYRLSPGSLGINLARRW
jgi:5-dehydro-2-deoxygluconokinase